jgi:lysophospholipase L1-like esterase
MIMIILAVLLAAALAFTGFLYWQAQAKPTGKPQYVALGSSFAAGIGLGERVAGSPLVCQRTVNSYPQTLARAAGMSLVDMTCSGATTKHVLRGGQLFLGPQLDGLGPETELVTVTIGGNDISYVGDLTFLAARKGNGITARAARLFGEGPNVLAPRDYDKLLADLRAMLVEIKRRSPKARIVVITYPRILPAAGTCEKLALTEAEVSGMRLVGDRLAAVTAEAARQEGAMLVDMQKLGAEHHACSSAPWVNGWVNPAGTPFHPTRAGAQAIAAAVLGTLKSVQ